MRSQLLLLTAFSALLLAAGCRTRPPATPQPTISFLHFPSVVVRPRADCQPTPEKRWQMVNVSAAVEPVWERQELEGVATLAVVPHAYPQQQLRLDAQAMKIGSVARLDGDAEVPLPYDYDNRYLTCTFPQALLPGDTVEVRVYYTARPMKFLDSLGGAHPVSDYGLYFIDPLDQDTTKPRQLWTQGETNHNSVWLPMIDEPNQKFTQEIYLTVPEQMTTVSNGILSHSTHNGDGTRTDLWVLDKPNAPYLVMIGAGNWVEVEDQYKQVPLYYLVEPEWEQHAMMVFGQTPAMMELMESRTGVAFPWPEFRQVVVRDFISGAMENTGAVVHSQFMQHDRRSHIYETYEGYVIHELAHQWFGDLVTCKSWTHLSLNEGFATLMEVEWAEHRHGQANAAMHRKGEKDGYFREANLKAEPIVNCRHHDGEELFDAHRYGKAGMVLYMLKQELGDSVFWRGVNLYLTRYAYGHAEFEQLRLALEEASGRDLNQFFRQYFYRAGHPEIEWSYTYDKDKRELALAVRQNNKPWETHWHTDRSDTTPYRLPFEIDIHTATSKSTWQATLTREADTFRFARMSEPLAVVPDPMARTIAKFSRPKGSQRPKGPSEVVVTDQTLQVLRVGASPVAMMEATSQSYPPDVTVKYNVNPSWYLHLLDDTLHEVRLTGVQLVADFLMKGVENADAATYQQLLDKLLATAQADPDSRVRAAVPRQLGRMGFYSRWTGTAPAAYNKLGEGTVQQQVTDVAAKMLDDSSWHVVSSAISLLSSLPPVHAKSDRALQQLEKKEEILNPETQRALAMYYQKFEIPGKFYVMYATAALHPQREHYFVYSIYTAYINSAAPQEIAQNVRYITGLANGLSPFSRDFYFVLLDTAKEKLAADAKLPQQERQTALNALDAARKKVEQKN